MKYLFSFAMALLTVFFIIFPAAAAAQPARPADDTLRIISSSSLNELTAVWLKEYSRINPDFKFSACADHGQNRANPDLFFVSDMEEPGAGPAAWKMSVAQNAIVVLFNSENPMKEAIYASGLSSGDFAKLFNGKSNIKWNELAEGGVNSPVQLYISGYGNIKSSLSDFINGTTDLSSDFSTVKPEELAGKLQNDKYSIGLCRLTDILVEGTNNLPGNILLLPVDRNGNGRIDSFEDIYKDPSTLLRGVWIGKYPHALCGTVYAASSAKPTDRNLIDFLSWIMNSGGQYLAIAGYGGLTGTERESNLALLNPENAIVNDIPSPYLSGFWIIVITIAVLSTIIATVAYRSLIVVKPGIPQPVPAPSQVFNDSTVRAPRGLYFDKTHTWAFMEKDGLIRVGLDDFLQHITGPVTGIKLREPGEYVRRGEKIITIIKDGKQLNIYAPVSGTIKSQNTDLHIDPSIMNDSPYIDGWIYLIEPGNWLREIQFMFMSEKYTEWLRDEFIRLREFLGSLVRENSAGTLLIMQDGGEMEDNALADLGPEAWEDFQTSFIDKSK